MSDRCIRKNCDGALLFAAFTSQGFRRWRCIECGSVVEDIRKALEFERRTLPQVDPKMLPDDEVAELIVNQTIPLEMVAASDRARIERLVVAKLRKQ